MKLCKDCKHYQHGWPPNLGHAFANEEFVHHYCMRDLQPDLVVGGFAKASARLCYGERASTQGCGPAGLYFEPA